jgi:hypothetical protein
MISDAQRQKTTPTGRTGPVDTGGAFVLPTYRLGHGSSGGSVKRDHLGLAAQKGTSELLDFVATVAGGVQVG